MVQFQYTVSDPMGLHARPVGLVVRAVAPYKDSCINIIYRDKHADARRMFSVMALQVKQGETITVTVDGGKEQEIADAIKNVFVSEKL
ncbi:MAG TPA: HPr family phosphocarrier protein [Candidatus Limihabitans stercoravium]|nr:HPr family phosphocarrier protein [Candidatus Limihabitans stercoravium]